MCSTIKIKFMKKAILRAIIKALLDAAIALMEKPPVKHSSVIREYENKAEKEARPLV